MSLLTLLYPFSFTPPVTPPPTEPPPAPLPPTPTIPPAITAPPTPNRRWVRDKKTPYSS